MLLRRDLVVFSLFVLFSDVVMPQRTQVFAILTRKAVVEVLISHEVAERFCGYVTLETNQVVHDRSPGIKARRNLEITCVRCIDTTLNAGSKSARPSLMQARVTRRVNDNGSREANIPPFFEYFTRC